MHDVDASLVAFTHTQLLLDRTDDNEGIVPNRRTIHLGCQESKLVGSWFLYYLSRFTEVELDEIHLESPICIDVLLVAIVATGESHV